MSDRYIHVDGLGFRYQDGTEALSGVDLSIGSNEFVALIGQNGSGKTTLSKCLNGLLKPSTGQVIVDGLDSRSTSIVQMVKRVGYVFQNPDHQLFNGNCWDEIAYGPRNIELPEAEVKERVEEAATVVGLPTSSFSEHPFFLSKGMRQRVAIAAILALRPQVIIVDEPTTGQDTRQSIEIMEFLVMLHQKHNHTVIIVTHDMDIVARYAHRVIAMAGGKVLGDSPPAELFSDRAVLEATFIEPPQATRLALRLHDCGISPRVLSATDLLAQILQ